MRPRSSAALALLALAGAAWVAPSGAALAQAPQPAAAARDIPQSLVFEHRETLDRLSALARRPGEVGAAASAALELFERHIAREQEYILPPLTLLPDIADGRVTPDMAWAVAMADRVRADRELIFQEHIKLADAFSDLLIAGEHAKDAEAVDFARAGVGDSLNDIEILEPTVLMIGDYLRSKLPAGQ